MNELNYASLSASKKLVENGIWLETDYFYVNTFSNMGWVFRQKGGFNDEDDFIPAPSMAEVWRELPFQSYIKKLDDGSTLVWICDDDADGKYIESNMIANTNPTDALIDLLVWLSGERTQQATP
jgi:hypothetical protein